MDDHSYRSPVRLQGVILTNRDLPIVELGSDDSTERPTRGPSTSGDFGVKERCVEELLEGNAGHSRVAIADHSPEGSGGPNDVIQPEIDQESSSATEGSFNGPSEAATGRSSGLGSTCDGRPLDMESLFGIMAPLLISIRIGGLMYMRPETRVSLCSKEGCRVTPSMVYSTILLCVFWLDFARSFTMFRSGISFDMPLFFKLLTAIWILLVCVNFTTTYSSSHLLLSFLDNFIQNVAHPDQWAVHIRKRCTIYATGCWVLVAMNMAYSVSSIYLTRLFEDHFSPFDSDHEHIQIIRGVLIVLQLFRSCAWIFPTAMYMLTSCMLQWQFEKLTEEFVRMKHRPSIFGQIEYFRQKHQKVCHMVEKASGVTGPLIGAQFTCNVGIVTLTLYILIWGGHFLSSTAAAACAFWMLSSLANLLIFCIAAGRVNAAAHSLTEHIYDLDLSKADRNVSTEMTLLTNRLTGGSIGFSVCGLFVVDMASILTLCGMLITYFLLMLDYSPIGNNGTTFQCNCSFTMINDTLQCISVNV